MATDYKALGKRISNARKQAGITQEALGEQLNMTRKHISVRCTEFCLSVYPASYAQILVGQNVFP